jgi:hypothetical protein
VPELELLQSEHLVAEPSSRPICGSATDAPETEDDHTSASHIRPSRYRLTSIE